MKWYNTLLVVGIIGAGCFLWGLTICSEQKFKREAAEAQKNTYKMRLDAALVVIDYYKGKFFLDDPQKDMYAFAKLKDYPVPIVAQKQIEKVDEAYLQYMQEKEKLERMKEKELERISKGEKWKKVAMNVSAYCPCVICCENFADGITASGHRIKPNDVFVAAPRKYPFGTEMIIEGYAGGKIVKVEDVGGAIKENKLDLFFHTHQEALNWGRKYISVKVRI